MDIERRQAICLFIDNYHDLKRLFFLKTPSRYLRLCSLILSQKGIRINTETFRENLAYIKRYTPFYSPFRSFMLPSAAFATISGKSFETAFNRLAFCRNALKNAGLRPSSHLIPAAMALFSISKEGSERFLASQAFSVFKGMNAWISAKSTKELLIPSVLLAPSSLTGKEIMEKANSLLNRLSTQEPCRCLPFFVQILACNTGMLESAATRFTAIFAKLERMKFRSPTLCFGTIVFLTLSGQDYEQAILEGMDTMSLLKLGKCFSPLEKEQAMLLASALIASTYLKHSETIAPIDSIISALAAACMI